MHISMLYFSGDKAPVSGNALYVVTDESDRTIKLLHPVTLETFEVSHGEFRNAGEQELWPNPYDENPRTIKKGDEWVTFPEQVARSIERQVAKGTRSFQAHLIRRVLAALRGLKLEQVPLLKDPNGNTQAKPRGFAVRSEKRPGVIDAIDSLLSRPDGVTVDEAIAELSKLFPERSTDGMRTTVRCQINRLPGNRGRTLNSRFDNHRGKVYQWAS